MINTNDVQQTLINNMIALRKSNGLTQVELGEKINYSDKTVSKWEKGDSCPNIEAICRIANFYGITVDELLTEDVTADVSIAEVKQRRYSKLIISLLAIIAVWTIATMAFVSVSLMHNGVPWILFVAATPVTAVVVLVFNSMWGKRPINIILISALIWTVALSVFLTFPKTKIWLIFIVGIPLQVLTVLWGFLKKK
jgi:transcriptional regulator with XRE-family HTH domain